MKKQALTTIGINTFAPSGARDEPPRPVSEDSEAYASKPEGRGRATLRWFIDTLALAGCGMAGVYVGVWLEPPPADEESPRFERDSWPAGRPVARID